MRLCYYFRERALASNATENEIFILLIYVESINFTLDFQKLLFPQIFTDLAQYLICWNLKGFIFGNDSRDRELRTRERDKATQRSITNISVSQCLIAMQYEAARKEHEPLCIQKKR